MQSIFELKEQTVTETPLLVFECTLPDGRIEFLRKVREKVEDRGGVGCHTHFQIGKSESFRRWQTSDIGQTVPQAGKDASHQLDVANSILKSDKVRATLT